MKKKISIIAKDFFELLIKDNINAYASSTAFFIFLSFIPMLLLIFSILPYTPISQTDFIELLLNFIPPSLQEGMVHMVNEIYEKSVSTISFAAIITLWSAAKGVLALMRGLNAVHDVNEKKGYFRLRLKALLYTVIFLVAIITSLVFMFFGKTISSMIVKDYPKLSFLFQVTFAGSLFV
jgi:membrane protein